MPLDPGKQDLALGSYASGSPSSRFLKSPSGARDQPRHSDAIKWSVLSLALDPHWSWSHILPSLTLYSLHGINRMPNWLRDSYLWGHPWTPWWYSSFRKEGWQANYCLWLAQYYFGGITKEWAFRMVLTWWFEWLTYVRCRASLDVWTTARVHCQPLVWATHLDPGLDSHPDILTAVLPTIQHLKAAEVLKP